MTLNSGSSWLSFLKYRLQARVTTSGFVCSFLFCGFLFWLCFYFHCKIGVEPRALCVLGKHSPKPQPSLGLWLSVCEHHHRSSEQTRASAGEEGRTEGRGRKERKKEEFHAPFKKGTYARCRPFLLPHRALQLLEAGIQGLENLTSSSVHSVAQTCLN